MAELKVTRPRAGVALLRVQGLSKQFKVGGHVLRAVDDVSFEIRRGTTFGVVGESGSGKSTLARCILQMVRADRGEVVYDGVPMTSLTPGELRRMRRRVQIVFQDPHGSLNRRLCVGEIVSAPLAAHKIGDRRTRAARVRELLDLVGLAGSMSGRRPAELSGGQAQRVAIARALALEPEFIVLDEAVSALDVSVRAQIMNLLRRLQDDLRLTYLFISHDLSVARYMSNDLAVMYRGRFVEEGTRAALFEDPRHPYTHGLLAAVPVADPVKGGAARVAAVPADDGGPLQVPGCRFHTRCPIGRGLRECQQDDPADTTIGDGHVVRCHHPQQPGSVRNAGEVAASDRS